MYLSVLLVEMSLDALLLRNRNQISCYRRSAVKNSRWPGYIGLSLLPRILITAVELAFITFQSKEELKS